MLARAGTRRSKSFKGAALSSAAPHHVSGVLQGAATAAAASNQQSGIVLAVEQGTAEPHSEVAVAGAVAVADIEPVRYTLKDLHLRFAYRECESAGQHRTCKRAVLMILFPRLESRRAMLMFLGTRLGMKGG
jgi:hypothetical protein